MSRRTVLAILTAVSLCQPARAGTPLWAETYAAMPGTQTSVDSESSGTVVAVVSGKTVVASKDAGVTWAPLSPLSSPPSGGSSHTRVSPSTKTLWFAENGRTVSATKDGGASWRALPLPTVVKDPTMLFEFATEVAAVDGVPSAAVGWAGSRVVEGCPYRFPFTPVYATRDGGARWHRVDLPVESGHVESISWLDAGRAVLVMLEFQWTPTTRDDDGSCGYSGTLARSSVWATTDGARSWRRIYRSEGPAIIAAGWSSPTSIAIVEEIYGRGRSFVSNDGGRTFSRKMPLYDLKGINGFPSMQFVAGKRGWLGTIIAGVFRTDTGGAEWTHEVSPVDGSFYGVPELTAIDRDSAVHAGPRALVTRMGEAPVAAPTGPATPHAAAPDVVTVTNAVGGLSSTLTLPVRGLPTVTWRVAEGA